MGILDILKKSFNDDNDMEVASIETPKPLMMNNVESEVDLDFYSKAITEDPNYSTHTQGFKEKPARITDQHLKQMGKKNSLVSAIVLNRQNKVAAHSKLVRSDYEKGFKIVLKDEESYLKKMKDVIRKEMTLKKPNKATDDLELRDAEGFTDDERERINWEIDRKARERLDDSLRARRKKVEEFFQHGGKLENRPFETEKWDLDAILRASVWDSLIMDKMVMELVPDQLGGLHHFFPIDAGTVKFASHDINRFKNYTLTADPYENAYTQDHREYLDKYRDGKELNEEFLENDMYRYVQVIDGVIRRAYTKDEIAFGMRNPTTDIYYNGYSICELELLVGLITSHLNTEYYNQAYYTQGFSAKGILHIEAPINKRKLESFRQQWQHMLTGSRNSFRTPIISGASKLNWIPLTQKHSDMEFENWLHYLVKMICSIYQIDPSDIGFGIKDAGKSGMSGDNTAQKLAASQSKGLLPLLRFIENYFNKNIMPKVDPDFEFKFVGTEEGSYDQILERQKMEVTFKTTVNEIRRKEGKVPIPGMDDLILDQNYIFWYTSFSDKAFKKKEQDAKMNLENQQAMMELQQKYQPAVEEVIKKDEPTKKSLDIVKSLSYTETLKKPILLEYYQD